jgi:hypothetical protein
MPDASKVADASAGDVNSEVYFEDDIPSETIDTLKGELYCIA